MDLACDVTCTVEMESVRRKDTWQHQETKGSIRLLQRLPNSSPQQWQLWKNGSVIALLSAPSHGQGMPSYETVLYRFTLSWIEGCPLKNRKTSSCWELQTLNRWDGWSSEQNFVSWPNLEECVRHQIQLLWFKRAAILRNILSFWLHTKKIKSRNTIVSVHFCFITVFLSRCTKFCSLTQLHS